MKNKRTVKILTLALSCLLIVGAVIGISASAEEPASVSIAAKNIAYEGAIQILYAVDADNVPDGAKVQMYFYDTEPTESTEPAYVKDAYAEKITIADAEYLAFFSHGIAPKNMRAPIYAKAVIVNGEGGVLAESAVEKYSVWQYAINRFEKSATPDQEKLYSATLDYGASVQEVLVESKKLTVDEILANGGWANEYCGIKEAVTYQGVKKSDGEVTYYAPGTMLTLGEKMADTVGYAKAALVNYTDMDGNVLGDYCYKHYVNTPGVTTVTANYMPAAYVSLDYTYAEDVNTKYSASTSLANLGFKNDKFGTSKTETAQASIVTEDGNSYLYASTAGTRGGISTFWHNTSTTTAETAAYDVAFFETDLRWDGSTDTPGDTAPVYLRFYDSGTADVNRIGFIIITDTGAASDTFKIGLYPNSSKYVSLPKGEWFNMRVTMAPESTTKVIEKLYINGELVDTYNYTNIGASVKLTNFMGATFYTRNTADNSAYFSYAADNTVFGTYTTYMPGNGGMYTDETAYGTKLGFDSGAVSDQVANSSKYTTMKDGVLDLSLTDASTGFGLKNLEPQTGSTHIVEFDYNFKGANATDSNANFGWLGLTETGRDKVNQFLPLKWYVNEIQDGDEVTSIKLYYGNQATLLMRLQRDTWYNIRFVYVANNTVSGDTTTYGGTVNVFINNKLVTSFTASGYTEGSDSDSEPNTTFEMFGFEFRSKAYSGIANTHMQFDNAYLETVADE